MFITHDAFKPKNIKYGFYTKKIPESKHRYMQHQENHENNNKVISNIFGAEKISVVEQKHTNKVIYTKDYNGYCIADGQVTDKPGIALGVLTADCVPILLIDSDAAIIASVHAGWKGARSSITDEAIEQMKSLGAKRITAIIGPCIKQHSYEVDNDFYDNFMQESDTNKELFIPSVTKNRHMFDLPKYVKTKLSTANIDNILDINRNTYDDEENFFSYRRTTHNPSSPMGSIVSIVMIKTS